MNFLILAAGKGERIGKPKLRIELNGKSFLRIILETISGMQPEDCGYLSNVVCIIRRKDYTWARKEIKNYLNGFNRGLFKIHTVVNDIPDADMLSSIKIGLKIYFRMKLSEESKVDDIRRGEAEIENTNTENRNLKVAATKEQQFSTMLIPVDHPFVSSNTYKTLLTVTKENPGKIIRPSFKSKAGHPIIIPFELTNEILISKEKTLNEIIKKSKIETLDISVDDEYILKNINYQKDLK